MAVMHEFDWLFSVGVIFFLLSVWGIGANVGTLPVLLSLPSLTNLTGCCQLVRYLCQLQVVDLGPSWHFGDHN